MSIYTYIFTMALTTYLIRVLPLTIFRKPIRSRFCGPSCTMCPTPV